jgi:hypothetical protein
VRNIPLLVYYSGCQAIEMVYGQPLQISSQPCNVYKTKFFFAALTAGMVKTRKVDVHRRVEAAEDMTTPCLHYEWTQDAVQVKKG